MSTEHKQDWPEVVLFRSPAREHPHWPPCEAIEDEEPERYAPASKLQAVREELERRAQAAEVKADTQFRASLKVKDGFPALKDSATVWGARSLAYKEAAELLGRLVTEGESGELQGNSKQVQDLEIGPDLDAAVEAAAKRAYEKERQMYAEPAPPWDEVLAQQGADGPFANAWRRKLAGPVEAALPHLQDQGLRDLAEWCGSVRRYAEGSADRALTTDHACHSGGEAQAFRAVQAEIERRIGEEGGRDQ